LVSGEGREDVAEIADRILRLLGFEVRQMRIGAEDSRQSAALVGRAARCVPLVVLNGSSDSEGKVFSHLIEEELLENSYVVVLTDGFFPKAASMESRGMRCITVTNAKEQNILHMLEALVSAHECLLSAPDRYLPVDRRSTEAREPYVGLRFEKNVTIFPSTGQGIVDFEYHIQVQSASFEGTSHYVGLTSESPGEEILPSLANLVNRPVSDRYVGEKFSFGIISPNPVGMRMNILELPNESSERTRVFRLLFSPQPQVGQTLAYAVSWSHPQLFATHGLDTSVLRCLHEYDEVKLSFLFAVDPTTSRNIFESSAEPTLHIYNCLDMEVARLTGIFESKPQGLRYSWRIGRMGSNSSCVVKWKLRQEKNGRASN